jgi:penicillin amidase
VSPGGKKFLRRAGVAAALLLIAALLWGLWFRRQLQRSLPQLDGTTRVAGLAAPVTVTRDALGVPTLQGANRPDLARALGWLHAQDRFFQMDLMRRSAAGELAALFGRKALPADKAARIHGFRRLAREDVLRLDAGQRALLEAYTAGVNAGLHALAKKPFEYILLRAEPADWQPEDTILVAFAMALQLDDSGNYERSLTTLRNVRGTGVMDFLAPLATTADAAMDGSLGQPVPIPSAREFNLRGDDPLPPAATTHAADAARAGSNSFALSGAHTANGAPLLANDMHLHLGVPNTWYRARLVWPGHTVTGVTLPGTPLIVAGSNGRVAWGFTHACADTSDIVIIEPNSITHSLYRRGDDLLKFKARHEVIDVKGGKPVNFDVSTTIWGPVIGTGEKERPLVLHWTLYAPGAINLSLLGMESAQTVPAAMAVAHRAGIPAQNLLAVDDQGHIGWTIAGALPRRSGYDGRLAVTWTYNDRFWDGALPAAKVPAIIDPPDGRLWTANNRIVGEPGLGLIGDGGYDRPFRAARIRDDLMALHQATPADLLAIQLDDHAPLLDRWRELLLATLAPAAVAGNSSRAKVRHALENWDARARVDAVGYRLVRLFRQQTADLVFTPVFAPCRDRYPDFNWHQFHYEQPLWALLQARPVNWLNPRFKSWDDLLLAAVDGVVAQPAEQGVSVDRATWGRRNRAQIRHPFSLMLPGWLTAWLNLPADPLPGDSLTPRVQSPDFGASERFVVSPGHEDEGIFEMPGGQSGHPLSPFYRAGHAAWVHGQPTPFLPGPAVHTLTLEP